MYLSGVLISYKFGTEKMWTVFGSFGKIQVFFENDL